MTNLLLEFALRWRKTIIAFVVIVFALGAVAIRNLAIDALPDVSPKMVRVFVEVNATAAEEVERLITAPIEREMRKIKGVTRVKSVSSYGLSTIRIYFKDNIDINLARQNVNERIKIAQEQIPEFLDIPHGIEMGAISSGTGKILAYYLAADSTDLNTLRGLQDNTIKPFFENTDGVSEILSQGGFVNQIRVDVNPEQLEVFDLSITDISESIKRSNIDVGGGLLAMDKEEWIVRSLGRIADAEELKAVYLKNHNGQVVLLGDVADIRFGPAERRGVASLNGQQEIVTGSVYKSPGSNSFKIIKLLHGQIEEINKRLPQGIRVVPYYDQGILVAKSIDTALSSLYLGLLLVAAVSIIFLRKLKVSLFVLLSIPFSMIFSLSVFKLFGIAGDLMSLGGLAIGLGMIVDASIIMVEKIQFNIERKPDADMATIIRGAYAQVARPLIFTVSIIAIVFLPVWSLIGIEGKMFRPLVISVSIAMFGSLLYALVVVPALFSFFAPRSTKPCRDKAEQKDGVFSRYYRSILVFILNKRAIVTVFCVVAIGLGAFLFKNIGKTFMPIMEEGTIHVVAHMDPDISLDEISRLAKTIEQEVITLDEVNYAVTDIGYGDVGPHVHHTNYASLTVGFHPKEQWKDAKTQNDVIEKIYQKLMFFPANSISFTQPIQHEVDDLISGSGSQVVIKVFGNDMEKLKSIGDEVHTLVAGIDGAKDLYIDQVKGQTQLLLKIDRAKIARSGLNAEDVQGILSASVGGERVGKMFDGYNSYDIAVRLGENYRNTPEAIGNLIVKKSGNQTVRLSDVATIEKSDGLMQIDREQGNRFIKVQCNVRGRDIGGFIDEAQKLVNAKVSLPLDYYVSWGGQFELQEAANKRFAWVIPITLIAVLVLLAAFHGSIREVLLIIFNIPLAIVGGIALLYLSRQNLSIPSTIGFIALFGIALEDSLVLVNRIKYLRSKGMDLQTAVVEGAVSKLRPAMMTSLTTVFALVPLVFATGVGAEIQRPLAIVIVGGLFSSTLLTLFIIPVFYRWFFTETGESSNIKIRLAGNEASRNTSDLSVNHRR